MIDQGNFYCWMCRRPFPVAVLNIHHKIPQAAAGTDDPKNLVALCVGCHDSMHAVTKMLMNERKAGMVNDALQLMWPNDRVTHKNCMELARLCQEYFTKKKENDLGDFGIDFEEAVSFGLPLEFKNALRTISKDTRYKGRSMGIARYVKLLVLRDLASKFPLLRKKIEAYMQSSKL